MAYNPKLGPSNPAAPARVFVLAEDALAADGLRAALASEPNICCVPHAQHADVVVWDLGLDWPRSLTTADTALALASARKQVVVALVPDEVAAVHALQRGALAVISRRSSPAQLTAAVMGSRLGLCVLDAELADHYIELPKTATPGDPPDTLTSRERGVLDLLALGLSNKVIASRLGVSVHTVKFHVNSILAKLGADTRTGAVASALRRGLITT